MARSRLVKNLLAGAVAGIAGTVVLDLVQFARYRRGGGESSLLAWEFGGVDSWDDVSAPGEVARTALTAITGRTPPDSWASPAQAITHWGTGATWGATLGLAASVRSLPWCVNGALLAAKAWLTPYVVLPPFGIYQPIWKYDAKTLASDFGAHLAYGTTTAAVYRALRG